MKGESVREQGSAHDPATTRVRTCEAPPSRNYLSAVLKHGALFSFWCLTDSPLPLGLRLKFTNGFPAESSKPLPKGSAPRPSGWAAPLPERLRPSDCPDADDNFRICSSIASTCTVK